MESKSDFVVGLNHMANVIGPAFFAYILWMAICNNFIKGNLIKDVNTVNNIIYFGNFLIVLILINWASKTIKNKYIFENENKVVLTSILSFWFVNLLFIVGMAFFSFKLGMNKVGFIEILINTIGIYKPSTIIGTFIFSGIYYFIAIKSLK